MSKGYFDTNILVNISLIDQVELFYMNYSKIKICEQVKYELEKWNIADSNFIKVYLDSREKIASDHIEVVSLEDFKEEERKIISYYTRSLKSESIKEEEDLGEIYSVFMAQLQQAPYFCTNDNKFVKRYKKRHFKNLRVIDFSTIINQLFETEEEIQSMSSLLKTERAKMDNEFETLKTKRGVGQGNGFDEESIDKLYSLKFKLTE